MADAGGGHFYFVASAVEIRDHITSEVGETLEVVARDVTLEVTAPETVRVESMAPFRTEARGSRTLIARSATSSRARSFDVVLRVTFPFGEVGREIGALVGVTDRDERLPPGRAGPRRPSPSRGSTPTTRRTTRSRGTATSIGSWPRSSPPAPARRPSSSTARATTRRPRRRWPACQGGSATTRAATRSSRRSRLRCGWRSRPTPRAMPEMARKSRHWAASNVARMRTADGQSVKRPKS